MPDTEPDDAVPAADPSSVSPAVAGGLSVPQSIEIVAVNVKKLIAGLTAFDVMSASEHFLLASALDVMTQAAKAGAAITAAMAGVKDEQAAAEVDGVTPPRQVRRRAARAAVKAGAPAVKKAPAPR